MAEAAVVGGHRRPFAIDYFADADTKRLAATIKIPKQEDGDTAKAAAKAMARAVAKAVAKIGGDGRAALIYGSPLARSPQLLKKLEGGRLMVLGNSAAAIAALEKNRAFFKAVRPFADHPPLANRPAADRNWLAKTAASGGLGIRPATVNGIRATNGSRTAVIYQKRIDGEAVSLNFLAADGRVAALLFSTSTPAPTPQLPFRLGTLAVRRWGNGRRQLLGLARRLAKQFSLKGLNTLDGIIDRHGKFYALELNPRPGAALRLLDPEARGEVLGWHIAACVDGILPKPAVAARLERRGRGRVAIVYNNNRAKTMPPLAKPHWAADWPTVGQRLAADEPFCTIKAADSAEHRRRLASITARIGL